VSLLANCKQYLPESAQGKVPAVVRPLQDPARSPPKVGGRGLRVGIVPLAGPLLWEYLYNSAPSTICYNIYVHLQIAAETLSTQLKKVDPQDSYCLRFTQATCFLHLERYKEAITAYKKVTAAGLYLGDEGLEAARLGQQPDWDNL